MSLYSAFQASYSEQHEYVQSLSEHIYRRDQHPIQQAVCSFQIFSISSVEDRVEEQCVPGPFSHSRTGSVRSKRPWKTHHGHWVHWHHNSQRGCKSQREDLRGAGLYMSSFQHIFALIVLSFSSKLDVFFKQNRGIYMFRTNNEHVIDATLTGGPAR